MAEKKAGNKDMVDTLLARLKPDIHGWHTRIPAEMGLFFGLRLALSFEVQRTRERNPPKRLNDKEKKLARAILENLNPILRGAERRFKKYARRDPNASSGIDKPEICIVRGLMDEEHPEYWALRFRKKATHWDSYDIGFGGTELEEISMYNDLEYDD